MASAFAHRSMSPFWRDPLVWVGAAVIAIAFLSSDGLFIADELIYYLGTQSIVHHGSFVVHTGYEQFHSSGLRLLFLVDGAHGMVPQYPPGYAVLAAPFDALFGARGFVLINAVAAVAAAFTIRALTHQLFASARTAVIAPYLFLLGTFALDYAYGVWPQMLAAYLAIASILCVARSLDATNRATFGYSIAAGSLIGGGMLVRLDALLLLPAFIAFHIVETRQPARPITALLLGLLPGTILLSLANHFKFGTFNPLSYGSSGGGTDLTSYWSLLALLPLGIAILLAIRWGRRRPLQLLPILGLAAAILVIACSAGLIGGIIGQCLSGIYALIIDITRIGPGDPSATVHSDGTVLFFGMPKKALAQSLPWLGILPLLILDRRDAKRTRGNILLLLVCAFWIAPFALRSWYGGMASNMRYLLPIVPLLCILAINCLDHLRAEHSLPERPLFRTYIAGIAAAGAASFLLMNGVARTEQIYTLYLFLLLVILSSAYVLPLTPGLKAMMGTTALYTFTFCVGVSSFWAAIDVATSQLVRHSAKVGDRALRQVPGPLLVIGRVERFPSLFADYPAKIGTALKADCKDTETSCATLDFGLIGDLQKHGYAVLLYRPALSDRIRREVNEHGLKLAPAGTNATVADQFVRIVQ